MAFIPKYLSFHLAIGLLLHLVQGNDDISLGVQFKSSRYEEIAVQKSSLTLNCSVTSTDTSNPLTYIWHKDGLPLNSPRVELLNNGSLYFKKIRKNKKWNDEGVYQCIASNSIGSVLAPVILVKVRSIDKNFTKEPSPWQGYLGGVARFECNINSVPPPSYVWQKDKKNIPQNSRYTTFSSGVLQISNLKYEDEGLYRCMAYSSGSLHMGDEVGSFRWKHSKEAQLTVLYDDDKKDPWMLASPQNITGIIGDSAVLECLIGGNPLPGVIWTRKDKKPMSGEEYGYGNLKFYKLARTDEGTYVCSSKTSVFPPISAEAFLTVLSSPVVVTALKSQKWPVARNVIFKCEIDGVPKPNVKWYLNGNLIKTTSDRLDLRKDKLVVLSAEPSHSGYYQCVGHNSLGQDMSTALLEIFKTEGAPEPPTKVSGTAISSSTIHLTWSPAPSDTRLLTYMVMYSKASGRMESKFVSASNCTIDNLDANSNYTFFVKSFNTMGASPGSKGIKLLTKEDKPYVAPEITIHSTQADNIVIEWDEIPKYLANGVIRNYSIYYRRDSGSTEHFVEIDGSHKSYTIPGVDPDTDYEVRVKASTSIGYPDFSDIDWPWVKYHTPEYYGSSVPLPPRIWLSYVNSTSVSVTWQQKALVENASFELTVRNLKTDVIIDEVMFKSSATSYTLSNLENNTSYEITLLTRNSLGASSPASKQFSTSDNGVPSPPENLQTKAISSSVILLSWSSERGEEEVDTYEICFYPSNNVNLIECIQSVTTNAKITKLKPFTKYSFKIRPKVPNHDSQFSKIVSIKTKQDVPSAPTNITWDIVSPGIVEIHWHPPTEPNGVITSYIIFYNIDASLPDTKWNNVTQNGVITTARVDELTATSYYVKLSACTEAGQGGPSKSITVYPRPCVQGRKNIYPCTDGESTPLIGAVLSGQQVGIIVGATIGILCIIICILVIVFRRKCFYSGGDHQSLPPSACHSNGHLPRAGNGHIQRSSEHIPMYSQDVNAFTPMLTKLLENEQSDSKGGGNMIVTPNGVKTRGSSCQNGHIANGHVPSFNSSSSQHDGSSNKEEHHGLIAAMLAATDGSLTGDGTDSAANCSSVMEGEDQSVENEDLQLTTDHSPQETSSSDGVPCLNEAATPAVITETGQLCPNNSLPCKSDDSLLRNKNHQSTSTSPSRVNKELPPPPPDPPHCFKSGVTSTTLNSIPPIVAHHQIQTSVRDGRTVSAAKNSHSVA